MTNRKPSQAAQILAHLQDGNEITAIGAIDLFSCLRLAARIKELREDGHEVHSRTERSNHDRRKAWAVYYMRREG